MNCIRCNSILPDKARFCMYCGQPVTTQPNAREEQHHSHLTSTMPPDLVEKVHSIRRRGERKPVTALFADVVGSTSMAEQMDAEEWTEMMNGAFSRISPVIYQYEGTIARLLGDAILAFFGAPVAHEDDPARAITAALDILHAVEDYIPVVRAKYGIDFAIRIGINTGNVVVGDVGSDQKYEYTAMGDAINLAARLQSAARPGTALVSQYTYQFSAPLFDFRDLGPIKVKGKSKPVHVYEVVSVKDIGGKLRGLTGLSSPMIGRSHESSTLLGLSTALQAGKGGVVTITGEAGLGKSRLVSEWKSASGDQVAWIEGKCLSYGDRLAYHLVIDLTRSLLGLYPTSGEAQARAALKATITKHLEDEPGMVFPFLANLLSLPLEDDELELVSGLDPHTLQNQYLAAFSRVLTALAGSQPLGVILEDIHWADPSSISLLTQLLPLARQSSILFALVARPDQSSPGWKLVAAAEEMLPGQSVTISLNRLTEQDSRQLVSNLLAIDAIPEKVRNTILQKTEGNPFFVEEVIRMLIDTGAIVPQANGWVAGRDIDAVEVPENLQSLLLARIDRLPEQTKRVLRMASVLGRQFPADLLERLMEQLG